VTVEILRNSSGKSRQPLDPSKVAKKLQPQQGFKPRDCEPLDQGLFSRQPSDLGKVALGLSLGAEEGVIGISSESSGFHRIRISRPWNLENFPTGGT
jgi:hypothetical protein